MCLNVCVSRNVTRVTYIYISELDKGIDLNHLPNDRYGHWLHIGTILGSWSPSQESERSSKVSRGSWFFSQKMLSHFLMFLVVLRGLSTFYFFFGTTFEKSYWQNVGKVDLFFYILDFWVARIGAKTPKRDGAPKQGQSPYPVPPPAGPRMKGAKHPEVSVFINLNTYIS